MISGFGFPWENIIPDIQFICKLYHRMGFMSISLLAFLSAVSGSPRGKDAAKAVHRERIQELLHFINSQPRTITEFDEALVKKLLESVKVCEFFLEFRFKSGVTISIEK